MVRSCRLGVERAEAREAGVDYPQLVACPGEFMHANVPGNVRRARDEAGVVLPSGLDQWGDGRAHCETPTSVRGSPAPAGQPPTASPIGRSNVRTSVDRPLPVGPRGEQLVRLVSRYHERRAEFLEQRPRNCQFGYSGTRRLRGNADAERSVYFHLHALPAASRRAVDMTNLQLGTY